MRAPVRQKQLADSTLVESSTLSLSRFRRLDLSNGSLEVENRRSISESWIDVFFDKLRGQLGNVDDQTQGIDEIDFFSSMKNIWECS